jgi:hypothetical protein
MPAAVLGLLAFIGHAAASQPSIQEWNRAVSQNLATEPVAGLLNLPEIVGSGCGPDQAGSVALYAARSTAAAPIASIRLRVVDRQPGGGSCGSATVVVQRTAGGEEQLPTDESGYETPAAVVYQRSGTWFRIALQRGSAWVKRETPDDFLSYPELLTGQLAYLRDGWDGQLWRAPAAGAPTRVPDVWASRLERDIPADVLEVRSAGGTIWIRVRLRTETCGETIPDATPATGWIRAYRSSGRTSAWFHSRGC